MARLIEHPECRGLRVELEWPAPVATLRYFSGTGDFAERMRAAGIALPEIGAAHDTGQGLILAWRSPSETLCLGRSAPALAQLAQHLAGSRDGCLVELTGALTLLHLTGPRIADLIARLGGPGSLPAPGESRRSRMAEVPVLAVCVDEGAVSFVVERGLAEHLGGWIRETMKDFASA